MLITWLATASAQDVSDPPEVTVGGYAETFWSYNFNRPSNGVTNLRGFDNRHNSISLSNVALDASGSAGDVTARVVLQAGLTPNTYYLAEPAAAAAGGVGESDRVTWRNVQQAYGAYNVAGGSVTVEAGLFLSPIGPESLPIKDSWNFSRSNLFYGLPFYHTGVRAGWQASKAVKLTGAVYNGWNSVVDNNAGKSLSGQVLLTAGPVTGAVLYFGGPERPTGTPEGAAWRHLGDLWVQIDALERLSVLVHGDVGLENNEVGTNTWAAGALYARVQPVDPLYVVARGDLFTEKAADGAGAIFWPNSAGGVGQVASATLTLDYRPADHLSLRLEGRHDTANAPMFFEDTVGVDPATGAPIADARSQDTVTAGIIAWF